MAAKTYRTTVFRDGSTCFIPVTFDPRKVFGKVRAPVVVTINGYSYRSTIASMGGTVCVPLRKSNREAAGLEGGETLRVTLALDSDKREVQPPADLVAALKAAPQAWSRWRELSYTHQREHAEAIEQAVKPETRQRRIRAAVAMVSPPAPPPAPPSGGSRRLPAGPPMGPPSGGARRLPAGPPKGGARPVKKTGRR